ncbi:hypothetical protein DR64_2403 [Paraburkholderia xenovorans LB400]|uniref:hypothetical protein n=1 Tax=Paraburkholderia xenovorans TaxID=36873 RepID=UPI00003C4B86|nr:hypothetical protein [Paraburkholderia xenovorans]AIP33225.1 hypothetical protein DR64_2403 [Paraburkholderia xenovorans LB400]
MDGFGGIDTKQLKRSLQRVNLGSKAPPTSTLKKRLRRIAMLKACRDIDSAA